jgi:hypothetical protein
VFDVGARHVIRSAHRESRARRRRAYRPPNLVDAAPVADREQPATEVLVAALETRDRRRDIDPDL